MFVVNIINKYIFFVFINSCLLIFFILYKTLEIIFLFKSVAIKTMEIKHFQFSIRISLFYNTLIINYDNMYKKIKLLLSSTHTRFTYD